MPYGNYLKLLNKRHNIDLLGIMGFASSISYYLRYRRALCEVLCSDLSLPDTINVIFRFALPHNSHLSFLCFPLPPPVLFSDERLPQETLETWSSAGFSTVAKQYILHTGRIVSYLAIVHK